MQQIIHFEELILEDKNEYVGTWSSFRQDEETFLGLVSVIELVFINKAPPNPERIMSMQEKLNQFSKNDVWDLIPRPKGKPIIGTKWVFINKLNEQGDMERNKVELVAWGHSQQEGIDYTETFAPLTMLRLICLLISFVINLNIILYHTDVKSAFLNGCITKKCMFINLLVLKITKKIIMFTN